MGTLANSKDPDKMLQALHFIRVCTVCEEEKKSLHLNLEILTCDPLIFIMGHPRLIASNQMEAFICIQRVKGACTLIRSNTA